MTLTTASSLSICYRSGSLDAAQCLSKSTATNIRDTPTSGYTVSEMINWKA